MSFIQAVEEPHLRKDLPPFKPGDTVKVQVKVVEGDKERLQAFEGICIRRRGTGESFPTASIMARRVARRMSVPSISAASTAATAQVTATAWIASAMRDRAVAVSSLLSARPGRTTPAGRMTAAATTGPARLPRPASSTPAMQDGERIGERTPFRTDPARRRGPFAWRELPIPLPGSAGYWVRRSLMRAALPFSFRR